MTYDLVLITGAPGVGKSTISDALAKQLPNGVHISADDLRTSIKGGFKSPSGKWDSEVRRQYYLSFKNAASIAKNFIDAGFKVVIDDAVHGGELYEEWKKYFSQFNYLKVLLQPSKEHALERNKTRTSHFVQEDVVSRVYDNFAKHDYSDWLVIDNSSQSVEEVVSQIRKHLAW